eukprot:6244755-Lingulodinium_polyedra.AAC.1
MPSSWRLAAVGRAIEAERGRGLRGGVGTLRLEHGGSPRGPLRLLRPGRRLHAGGHLPRGLRPRWAPGPQQAHSCHDDSGISMNGHTRLSPWARTGASATSPTAGRRSRSRTATPTLGTLRTTARSTSTSRPATGR